MYTSELWLNVYGDSLKVIGIFNKNDELTGSFNLYLGSKLGQQYIITPPYATDIGLWYKDESNTTFQRHKLAKNIITAISNYLSNQKVMFIDIVLPANVKDAQPFLWDKFDSTFKYTYLLNLKNSEDSILQNMSPERRKNIKDGQKNIEVFKCVDYDEAFDKIVSSLSENNAHFNKEIVKKIVTQFPSGNNHICIGTKTNNELSSLHFITVDKKTANYIFGWNDKQASSIAGTFGLWSCILEAKKTGIQTFNFSGSAIPSIEKYFRGFGGELTSCIHLKKQNTIGKVMLKVKK